MENNRPLITSEFIERIREDERSKSELFRELGKALRLRDAVEYASLCMQLGLKRPRDMVLYQEGVATINQTPHYKLPVAYYHSDSSNTNEDITSRKSLNFKPFKVVELALEQRVNPDAILEQRKEKIRILSHAGYKGGYIKRKKDEEHSRRLSFMELGAEEVGRMFQTIYYQGVRNNRKREEELLLREAEEMIANRNSLK